MGTPKSLKDFDYLVPSKSTSLSSSTSGSHHERNDNVCREEKNYEFIRSHQSIASTSSEDFEDKYLEVSQSSVQEREAEEWLTRKKELMVSINWGQGTVPHETQSTLSSPGKSSMRERLAYRIRTNDADDSFHQHSSKENIPERGTLTASGTYGRSNLSTDDCDHQEDRYSTRRIGPPPPPPPPISTGLSTPDFESMLLTRRGEGADADKHAFTPRPTKESKTPIPMTRPSNASTPQLNDSILRLSRTVRYGRRGEFPVVRKFNRIRLHIYDLIHTDTMMQLPWGCDFPIGKCFQAMNNGLHALGTGAYHCGIEINGIEYAYGANELEGSTGVFTCMPKHSPGYEYRSTIDFGDRQVKKTEWTLHNTESSIENAKSSYREISSYLDGRDVIKDMATEYHGMDYDLLRKNCCTFAKDAALRLGVKENEIPQWFMNLADAGAKTQDFSEKAWEPISSFIPLGTTDIKPETNSHKFFSAAGEGFEVIAQNQNSFKVVEAVGKDGKVKRNIGVRRTLSWTY